MRAVRRAAIASNVLPAVPHLPRNAVAQQTVYGRIVAQHWCAEPDQLQHAVRAEDAHDHMPGHSAAGVYGVPVDNRELDAQTVREVNDDHHQHDEIVQIIKRRIGRHWSV